MSCRGGGGSGVSCKWQDIGDRGWKFDGGAIAGHIIVDVMPKETTENECAYMHVSVLKHY